MRRIILAALALVVATTACGAAPTGSRHTAAAGSGSTSGTSAAESKASTKATPRTDGSHSSARGSNPKPTPMDFRPRALPNNSMPLEVTMTPLCARRGDTIAVAARSLPGAKLAFTAYYEGDNDFMPDIFYLPEESNVTGSFTWRFTVRPTTPYGPARVIVVAAKDDKGASVEQPFVVADRC